MLNDIGESTIEGNEDTAFGGGDGEQAIIRNACQLLVTSKHYIVAGFPENCPD